MLNNSPIHLAIDASASHVISIELDPLVVEDPLKTDDRNETFNFLETGVTTFTTLLRRAIERDVRRTVTWNRFLTENPSAALATEESKAEKTKSQSRSGVRFLTSSSRRRAGMGAGSFHRTASA